MMTAEKIDALKRARMELVEARARGSGMVAARERMKNLLFNYSDELVAMAVENEKLKADVAMLEAALEEGDQENNDLRRQLKELKEHKKEHPSNDE